MEDKTTGADTYFFAYDATKTLTKEMGWVFNFVHGIYERNDREVVKLWNPAGFPPVRH